MSCSALPVLRVGVPDVVVVRNLQSQIELFKVDIELDVNPVLGVDVDSLDDVSCYHLPHGCTYKK